MVNIKLSSITIISFFVFLALSQLQATENYKYFIEAQSLKGPTGYIYTYSPKTVPEKLWSFGLHRFEPGINYGALRNFEAGFGFNLKEMSPLFPVNQENINRKRDEIFTHAKYRVLREKEHPADFSVGYRKDELYFVAGKYLPNLENLTFNAGVAWENKEFSSFFSLTYSLSWEQVILDFEPDKDRYNVGWRFLLSPEMKLDLFMADITHLDNIFIDNFIFGLTVVR